MTRAEEVANNLYTKSIENPRYQTAIEFVIKSWVKTGYHAGYADGVRDLEAALLKKEGENE